jgi:preprotein translocase subunit SecE
VAVSARRRAQSDRQPGLFRFLRETFEELRKVVWPSGPELYRYTLVVIVTVVVIALFIFAVDSAVSEMARRFVYSIGKTG